MAQHPLVSLPLSDPAYVQLAALDRQGCGPARISALRPFVVADIRRAVGEADHDPACAGAMLGELRSRFLPDTLVPLPADVDPALAAADAAARLEKELDAFTFGAVGTVQGTSLAKGEFRPLWRGVRDTDEGTPPVVGTVRLRAGWSNGAHLLAVTEAYAQTHRRNDPTVRSRAFRNTSGVVDFSEAYLRGKLGRLELTFGRGQEAWMGDGTESIALSANGPPVDRIAARVRWRRAEARAFVASASEVMMTDALDSLADGTPDTRFHRVLIGHALSLRAGRRLELTFGETLLSSRTTRGFDLAYANPLMPLVIVQNDTARLETDRRDNLVLFGGARFDAGSGRVGAELAVDDVQIDAEDRKSVADQLAWRVYASLPLPAIRPMSVGIEYRHADSYAYTRDFYTDVYQNYDHPLGSELGPDADLIRGTSELWLDARTRISVGVGRWRHGALRIDRRPAQGPNLKANKPFPSVDTDRPAVQSAILGDLSLQLLSLRLPMTLRVEVARIDNARNRPDAPALYVRSLLVGSYVFRYP